MSDRYDAGLLNDFGGGNVDWWQDYLRAEIDRANEFHADIHEQNEAKAKQLAQALRELLELTDDPSNDADPEESVFAFARSVLAEANASQA